MLRNITNESCELYHTAYCDLLNMPACTECMLNSGDEELVKQVHKDMQVMLDLLPEGGISPLFAGDECVLCKGKPNKRDCYGLLDLGHPEPARTKRTLIGTKVRAAVGSLIPVQLSVCNACRRRILTLEYLPMVFPVGMGILLLAALMLPGVSDSLERTSAVLPFALFIAAILAGFAAGRLATMLLRKRYAQHTQLDPFELPLLAQMQQKGWFPLNAGGKRLRMVFVKRRMRRGVGTGTPEEATAGQA